MFFKILLYYVKYYYIMLKFFLYCVSPCFILQNVIRHYHTFLCDIFKLIFLYLLLPVSCCIQDRPHFLSCYFNYIFEAPSPLFGNHYHSHAVWIFIQFLYFICHFSIHAFTLMLTALTQAMIAYSILVVMLSCRLYGRDIKHHIIIIFR